MDARFEASVSGTMVRDLLLCERRAHLDLHGEVGARVAVSDFVRMLWEGGCLHEDSIVASLPGRAIDLRAVPATERAAATRIAMADRPDWIVGGRLELGDRVGVPDLLMLSGANWSVGDIKSGAALDPTGRPNREYGVQVGHYAAILGDLGLGSHDRAFVVDRDGQPVWYDLEVPLGSDGSLADLVLRLVEQARAVIAGTAATRPALCHWRSVCRAQLEEAGDVTLVAGLGRALRSVVEPLAATVGELAALDLDDQGEMALKGLGRGRLLRFRDRARLLATPGSTPFARAPLDLPRHERELHLDPESNPLDHGLVYLHGVFERSPGVERFHAFFAEGRDDEERAFADAWTFLHSEPPGHVYHYSRFERTSYRVLAGRYPGVCSAADVEALFSRGRSTDLLVDVVQPLTEWPTTGVGIKALAKWLGFSWRDSDASGAASIGWYVEWCATRSAAVRRRIEEYNEDDCRATAVLLDALVALPVLDCAPWPATGEPE